MSRRVITPAATASYPHLDQAQAGLNGGKAKYSVSLVFAPGTDLKPLEAAVIDAASEKWGAKATSMIQSQAIRLPFRKDAAAKGYPDGSVFINVRTEQQPQCVYGYADSTTGKPAVISQEKIKTEIYPGAQVRASLTAFAYDTNGNKGVSFALNNVQKLGEGERIDGQKAATEEFTADLSQEPASLESLGLI